jgi:S1-C subfamily serine protease
VEKTGAYKPTSGIDSQASGFRIGGPYVLTNAHTIQSSEAYEVDGKEIPVLKDISPKFDLMLIKLPFAKAVPWIKIADPEVGTMVYAMTNSDGNDKFLVHGFVSKVDDHYLYLQEPTIPGASGSGLVNAKGELVGFFMQDETSTGDIHVPYTEAIPASIVRRFLEQVLPVEDLVKMGITVDTVAEK